MCVHVCFVCVCVMMCVCVFVWVCLSVCQVWVNVFFSVIVRIFCEYAFAFV